MSERKVVMITGAAGGIGSATVREFARRGYDLAITDKAKERLDAIAAEARALGATVFVQDGELVDMTFVETFARAAHAALGRIDVLVNNAAWRETATMRNIGVESWDRTLRICLTVPAFLSRWVAEMMRPRGAGVIINVSSVLAYRSSGMAPQYVAAKAGLDGVTRDLAILYGPMGIRVVSINPGAVESPKGKPRMEDLPEHVRQVRNYSEQMIPLGRQAMPEEIAKAIAMMASDDASYITGVSITVDGGWSHQWLPMNIKRQLNPELFE